MNAPKNRRKTMENEKNFYILKVRKVKSRECPILLLTKGEDKQDAVASFRKMRPKFPVLNPMDYAVIDTFDINDSVDTDRLKLHDMKYGTIRLLIEETEIGTYRPIEFNKPIGFIDFRNTTTLILQVTEGSVKWKITKESMSSLQSKIETDLLTTNIRSAFYNGDKEELKFLGQTMHLAFVFKNTNLEDLVNRSEKYLSILSTIDTEKYTAPLVDFYYYDEDASVVYKVDFTDVLTISKL